MKNSKMRTKYSALNRKHRSCNGHVHSQNYNTNNNSRNNNNNVITITIS